MSEYDLRQRIIDDLSYVSKMSVGEYTLYQKYLEIQTEISFTRNDIIYEASKQLVNEDHIKLINESKNNIWFPEDPMKTLRN